MKLQHVKALAEASNYEFFTDAQMKFWKRRIHDFCEISGYFITSEEMPNGLRHYTIRKVDFNTGMVLTIGTVAKYPVLREARFRLNYLRLMYVEQLRKD